ncbi:unnamed protein product [Oreochromis niloticus]|nr:unnamed protein product [Mustela putorius furo]
MNIHCLLFYCFCFFSALCSGGLISAKTITHTEGDSITVECSFSLSGRKKFLCKDKCEEGNVLIETEDDAAQRGRYSIQYEEGSFPVSSTVLYVSFTELTKSDSGRYSCGLERPLLPDSYQEFEVRVIDALKTFPETLRQVEQQQTDETAQALSFKAHVLPLVTCVTVLFAAVVLLFYKWIRIRDPDGLTTRRQSDTKNNTSRNLEFSTCRKCSPVSRCADFTSPVDETCSNQNKIYCNL